MTIEDTTEDTTEDTEALAADIEQAVGDMSDERERDRELEQNDVSPQSGEPGPDVSSGPGDATSDDGADSADSADAGDDQDEEDYDGADDGPSESVLERAVKAGFSLKQAKQFPNDDLLIAACDRIEGVQGDSGSQDGAGEAHEEAAEASEPGSIEELLSAIPRLSKDEYDDDLVDALEGMREITKRLLAENRELRGGRSKDWFSMQLEGVKKFTQGDPEKIQGLREKFDVLKAGYKAAGRDVTDEAVFSEASNLVLGEDMKAAERKRKAQAARRRSNQRIQRTSGRRVEAKADAHSEAADLVNQRIASLS